MTIATTHQTRPSEQVPTRKVKILYVPAPELGF